jgi:hypothetical protein
MFTLEKRRILAPIPASGVQFWVAINCSSHSAKDLALADKMTGRSYSQRHHHIPF